MQTLAVLLIALAIQFDKSFDVCNATPRMSKFKAAVYEHEPILPGEEDRQRAVSRKEALQFMGQNLAVYAKQAREAKNQGADILVFPENGLYGKLGRKREFAYPYMEFVPDPEIDYWIPCDDPLRFPNTEVQHDLSCMAKNNNLYIVANMGNVSPCSSSVMFNCGSAWDRQEFLYNVNVVFDPKGQLIARYHKHREEGPFISPVTFKKQSSIESFQTPFGRWGLFTGVELLSKEPAIEAVEKHNLANLICLTAVKDTPPVMSTVGVQSAFARRMGVNLLAANLHKPSVGLYGSGIYTPKGPAAYCYNGSLSSRPRLVVAELESLETPVPHVVDSKTQDTFVDAEHAARKEPKSSHHHHHHHHDSKGRRHQKANPHRKHEKRHPHVLTDDIENKDFLKDRSSKTSNPAVSFGNLKEGYSEAWVQKQVPGLPVNGAIFGVPVVDSSDDRSGTLLSGETREPVSPDILSQSVNSGYAMSHLYSKEIIEIEDTDYFGNGIADKITSDDDLTKRAFVSFLSNDAYSFILLQEKEGTIRTCSGELCCELTYVMTPLTDSYDLYAFGVFAGMHTTDGGMYLQVCALVRCADQSLKSCGTPTNQAGTAFSYLRIRGNFATKFVFPEIFVTSDRNYLQLAESDQWKFVGKEMYSPYGFSQPLVAAVLFGRVYNEDRTYRDDAFYLDPEAFGAQVGTACGLFVNCHPALYVLLSVTLGCLFHHREIAC